MSSGGGDAGQQFINKVKANPVEALGNAFVNYASLGTVGVDSGKFDPGVITHGLQEGFGQINGTNAARDAANKAGDALNAANAQKLQDLNNQRTQNMNNDITASNAAQGIRATANAQQNAMLKYNSLGSSYQRDFLGL